MWEEFSVIALTAALNNQLFVPGQVGATMVFGEEGVSVLIKPCFSPIPDPLGSAC
ncbi:MAG: hypothetical protein ACI9BH_002195 [Paracoccaceae bacterium]|jgi:hypothetical protein